MSNRREGERLISGPGQGFTAELTECCRPVPRQCQGCSTWFGHRSGHALSGRVSVVLPPCTARPQRARGHCADARGLELTATGAGLIAEGGGGCARDCSGECCAAAYFTECRCRCIAVADLAAGRQLLRGAWKPECGQPAGATCSRGPCKGGADVGPAPSDECVHADACGGGSARQQRRARGSAAGSRRGGRARACGSSGDTDSGRTPARECGGGGGGARGDCAG